MRKGFLGAVAASLLARAEAQAQSLPEFPLVPAFSQAKEEPKASEPDKAAEPAKTVAPGPVSAAFACLNGCDPGPQAWVGVDYLTWWIRGGPTVPLVTTGPFVGGAYQVIPGQPGAVVLFGDRNLDYDMFNGIRLSGGYRVRDNLAVEGNYFLLEQRTDSASFSSDAAGNPILARPVLDSYFAFPAITPDALLVSSPIAGFGQSSGFIDIVSHSRLQGGEFNAVLNYERRNNCSVDFLAGFRYLDLAEDLSVTEGVTPIDPAAFNGNSANLLPFTTSDRFATSNHFYGGQVGARVNGTFGKLSAGLSAKIALGCTDQTVDINGFSVLDPVNNPQTFVGGVHALPGNIGRYSQNQFAVVPEFGLNLGYQVTPNVKASFGYTFIYWSSVVRPGAEIDQVVDETLMPSSSFSGITTGPHDRPRFRFDESDFWAQGLNFGLAITF